MRPRVDERIVAARVFLVDTDGSAVGERERDEAITIASTAGLSLVEVQPDADPPVCKLMAPDRVARFNERVSEPKERPLEVRVLAFRTTMREADIVLRVRHAQAYLAVGGAVELRVERRSARDTDAKTLLERLLQMLGERCSLPVETRNTKSEIVALVCPRNESPGTVAE
ncbi:MAG TPA: hypothetical protein ENN56_03055 [Firmicutes bacterium]|nr:hypothetical protein [Bacillota bacterium]